MPELPEVETVKRILNTFIQGTTITNVIVKKRGIIKGDVQHFINSLKGRTFHEVKRIGKYLIFTFDTDLVLLSHLRMEGKYKEIMPGEPLSRYAHVIFELSDGRKLCYDDSRQFGTMELSTTSEYLQTKAMQNVGPEPFDIHVEEYFHKIQSRSGPIKLTLLDQKLMSGLGNIYVDEVLYLAKIHPETRTNSLDKESIALLIKYSIDVLNKAIIAGGTTVRSYEPAAGVHGNFQVELSAYGRVDEKCVRCGGLMKKIFVGGRGTTYCPTCQVNKEVPLTISITGQKAAGKSVVLAYLKAQGALVYDADTIAKDLYNDANIVNELSKKLKIKLTENNVFSAALLREHLLQNPQDIKIVNDFIHPLVKADIAKIVKNTPAKVIYFEVPLAFSKKINELFNYIIGIEVSLERQSANLELRGQKLGINADELYRKNRHKIDFIIINDGSKEDLINKFNALKLPLH